MRLINQTSKTVADYLFEYLNRYYPSAVSALVIEQHKGQNRRVTIPLQHFDFDAPTWDMVTIRLIDGDEQNVTDFMLTPDRLSDLEKSGYGESANSSRVDRD